MDWGMGCVPWVAEVKFAQQGGEYCGQEGSGIKLNGDQDFTKSCGKTQ